MKILPLKWRRRRDSDSDSSSPGDVFRRDKDHMIVIFRTGIATDEGINLLSLTIHRNSRRQNQTALADRCTSPLKTDN